MKRKLLITAAAATALVVALTACRTVNSGAGINGSGAYATGHYRNLFVEDGHSQPEVDAKVNVAFQQLFHGNPTNQAVYFEAGSNANGSLAYITDIKHNDVRTEGLSYGMMISVQMNRQA